MPIYILGKVRTLLEWADGLLSKMLDGLDWMVIPLRLALGDTASFKKIYISLNRYSGF